MQQATVRAWFAIRESVAEPAEQTANRKYSHAAAGCMRELELSNLNVEGIKLSFHPSLFLSTTDERKYHRSSAAMLSDQRQQPIRMPRTSSYRGN
jgi:hypothetical protein